MPLPTGGAKSVDFQQMALDLKAFPLCQLLHQRLCNAFIKVDDGVATITHQMVMSPLGANIQWRSVTAGDGPYETQNSKKFQRPIDRSPTDLGVEGLGRLQHLRRIEVPQLVLDHLEHCQTGRCDFIASFFEALYIVVLRATVGRDILGRSVCVHSRRAR